MSPIKRLTHETAGLAYLAVPEEIRELKAVGRVKLQYLKRSRECGLRLWNVLAPELPGYTYGPDSGFPTFSLDGLKEKGVI